MFRPRAKGGEAPEEPAPERAARPVSSSTRGRSGASEATIAARPSATAGRLRRSPRPSELRTFRSGPGGLGVASVSEHAARRDRHARGNRGPERCPKSASQAEGSGITPAGAIERSVDRGLRGIQGKSGPPRAAPARGGTETKTGPGSLPNPPVRSPLPCPPPPPCHLGPEADGSDQSIQPVGEAMGEASHTIPTSSRPSFKQHDVDERTAICVSELRFEHWPGYRVHFTRRERAIVLLLNGGDKESRGRDIKIAKRVLRGTSRRLQRRRPSSHPMT